MEVVSTGSFDLNDWLNGGYEKGVVTMLVGPSASGKSNFSTLAACSCAREKKVIYVDTEGGFSTERVRQIVGNDNYERILSNIFLLNPVDFNEQKESFDRLFKYMTGSDIGLIVVDSAVMFYRLEIGCATQMKDFERINEINRDVAMQMRSLVGIARRKNIPVLITNQVYSSFVSLEEADQGAEKTTNVVGGDLFKYWSKCIIELKNDNGRRAKLLRHRSLPESEFDFEIKNEGIFKKKLVSF